ncbi:L-lactate dehydrogenase [Endozoicomonas sp. SCSIO W0465]|uniref:L-lactate dehydrogenase n=1 Tax=Endozoicomonas sp. SCSIO W0465 TaxID=2918516 RepID=UPI0020763BE6|nr:L-lactate dehydrogenase [Endozoicomonas sp. SCSIO W0465]USE38468.1 L-lactate dehydrogenase [Endozoicomonas sp. SCSIO W0465]
MNMNKIGIIGTGFVGMAAAYSLFQQKLANEIVLVDKNHDRAHGEALDLMHGQPLVGRCEVTAGDFSSLKGAGVIVICAGVSQSSPDESRLQLLQRNIKVLETIASELDQHAPEAMLLIASNPVDILTHAMQSLSHRPNNLVIGTGTLLDTSRLRTLLADYYDVSPQSIHAYILGEHGDSEVTVWSSAAIAGLAIKGNTINGREYNQEALAAVVTRVIRAAYEIIANKGYTNWAIGLVIAYIIRMVRNNQRSVLPVSVRLNGEYGIRDICLSLPAVIGSDGVENIIAPKLDEGELAGIQHSANTLKASMDQLV